MRIAILIVALALAGCGKKKAPQSPGATESKTMTEGAEEQDKATPADSDDPTQTKSSDPQEGGE
jgi:hypothetical protein